MSVTCQVKCFIGAWLTYSAFVEAVVTHAEIPKLCRTHCGRPDLGLAGQKPGVQRSEGYLCPNSGKPLGLGRGVLFPLEDSSTVMIAGKEPRGQVVLRARNRGEGVRQ